MSNCYKFLWLNGVFNEETVNFFPTISPAANFWQKNFIESLCSLGSKVDVIGYPSERIWPFGRFFIRGKLATLEEGMHGILVGYINIPGIRNFVQYINLFKASKKYFNQSKDDVSYQIVWSSISKSTDITPAIKIAKYNRKKFGIPWICIVADGEAPSEADGYIYLAWSLFLTDSPLAPKIYIDGGVPFIEYLSPTEIGLQSFDSKKTFMYMGDIGPHGGVINLARAFSKIKNENIELLICGRGKNPDLMTVAQLDPRIKIKGFVSELELIKLAQTAFSFVNPRPSAYAPNKLNYPSKLLHYLAFRKPVISTFTDGMAPYYSDLFISVLNDSESGLIDAINHAISMDKHEYDEIKLRLEKFIQTHTWSYQVRQFISWIKNEDI